MYLAKMTTAQAKEAFEKDPIIVIPVGSTEQHGTQGALGTDFMVPSYLADHVEDVDNVIVAPTVPYGVCPYHLSFEGSINIGYEGLYMVLHGIMDSLMQHGAKRFVVLNGHGGNTPSIDRAALEVYHKGGVCASVDWWSLVAQLDKKFDGGHGDVLETSAMMAIAPESVHLSRNIRICFPSAVRSDAFTSVPSSVFSMNSGMDIFSSISSRSASLSTSSISFVSPG